MIKILIAEDQVLLASALAMILNLEEDLEVAGIAENGQEALVLAGKHAPDILLTDIERCRSKVVWKSPQNSKTVRSK